MSGWDDEDFEPPTAAVGGPTDKWDGEDSDDNIKDAWDAASDDETKKPEGGEGESEVKAVQKKKKKKLADIIAAKEEAKLTEEELLAERKAEAERLKTAEGKLEEKMRLQKMEENSNLELAKEMMGLKVKGGVDGLFPETKEQFDDLEKAIADKLQLFVGSEHYQEFAEKLVKRICLDMNTATLKKVKIQVENLHSVKLKDEKAAKSKKPGAKGRTTVKMDLDKDIYSGGVHDGFDDMDDFM